MKIAVLCEPAGWHFDDLRRAANNLNIVLHSTPWTDLAAKVTPHGLKFCCGDRDLTTHDAVLTRAMPAGTLEQVVFRMDTLWRLEQMGVTVVNPARTIETSVDKFLSLSLLQSAGIPVPLTGVFQDAGSAIDFFHDQNEDVVLKPIFGSQGRGLERIRSRGRAVTVFEEICGTDGRGVIYLQEFLQHGGRDYRLLVVGEQVFGMRRENAGSWIQNASRGADCYAHNATEEERQIALEAAKCVGGSFVGVDLVYDPADRPLVVEVNASPGWQYLAQATGMDIAAELLNLVSTRVGDSNRPTFPSRPEG